MSFAYDGLDRMEKVLEGGVGSTTSLATIGYNNRGLRSSMSRRGGDATTYRHDGVFRLAFLADTFVGGTGNTTSFSYNQASQIASIGRTNDAYAARPVSETRGYAANGLNQYITAGGASQVHDANGNLQSDGSTTFGYDVENRMVSATGVKNAQLLYDPLGVCFRCQAPPEVRRNSCTTAISLSPSMPGRARRSGDMCMGPAWTIRWSGMRGRGWVTRGTCTLIIRARSPPPLGRVERSRASTATTSMGTRPSRMWAGSNTPGISGFRSWTAFTIKRDRIILVMVGLIRPIRSDLRIRSTFMPMSRTIPVTMLIQTVRPAYRW
jgi:hypothetical protein